LLSNRNRRRSLPNLTAQLYPAVFYGAIFKKECECLLSLACSGGICAFDK
jgi:hypothetical protein